MTSSKKHRAPNRSPSKHRTTLAAYMAAKRHLLPVDPPRAKPVRQIAAETGMSIRTARYWLERDHFDEWFRWWPSFAAILADVQSDRDARAKSPPIELPDLTPQDIAAADTLRDADTDNRSNPWRC